MLPNLPWSDSGQHQLCISFHCHVTFLELLEDAIGFVRCQKSISSSHILPNLGRGHPLRKLLLADPSRAFDSSYQNTITTKHIQPQQLPPRTRVVVPRQQLWTLENRYANVCDAPVWWGRLDDGTPWHAYVEGRSAKSRMLGIFKPKTVSDVGGWKWHSF